MTKKNGNECNEKNIPEKSYPRINERTICTPYADCLRQRIQFK